MNLVVILTSFVIFSVVSLRIPQVSAVKVTIDGVPDQIDQHEERDLSLELDCKTCTSDSYIRAVFYTTGTSSYFGYTKHDSGNWVNSPGGSCTNYPSISSSMLKEGSWSGILKIKPDKDSSYYKGPGEYMFKVARYTGSCNSPTWSLEKTIAITGPTNTPTPTVTPVPSHTPLPTSTPTATTVMSPTQIPSRSPILLIKQDQSPVSSSESSLETSDSSRSGEVLSQIDENDTKDVATIAAGRSNKPLFYSLSMVAGGIGLLSGVLAWKKSIEVNNRFE